MKRGNQLLALLTIVTLTVSTMPVSLHADVPTSPSVSVLDRSWSEGLTKSKVITFTVTSDGVSTTCVLHDVNNAQVTYSPEGQCVGEQAITVANDGDYRLTVVSSNGEEMTTQLPDETFAVDTTGPEFGELPVLSGSATGMEGELLYGPIVFDVPTASDPHGVASVVCEKHSGDIFSDGELMQCTATDTLGNTSTAGAFGLQASITDLTSENAGAITPRLSTLNATTTADGTFVSGFDWKYTFTLPILETEFVMQFSDLTSGTSTITADNFRMFSAQSSNFMSEETAYVFTAANASSSVMMLVGDIDMVTPGRQIEVRIQVKIPVGTTHGDYAGTYLASAAAPSGGGGGFGEN